MFQDKNPNHHQCSLTLSALTQFCAILSHSHVILQCTATKMLTHSMTAELLPKPRC